MRSGERGSGGQSRGGSNRRWYGTQGRLPIAAPSCARRWSPRSGRSAHLPAAKSNSNSSHRSTPWASGVGLQPRTVSGPAAHTRRILGFEKHEKLTRESLLAAVHPSDRAAVVHALSAPARPDKIVEMELRVVGRGAEIGWITVKACAYFDAAGNDSESGGICAR